MMKKGLAVLTAWMLCLVCLCMGCACAQEQSIMQAVSDGYAAIDQSADNRIMIPISQTQNAMLQVDLISETNTLVRPYVFVELNADFYQIEHSAEDFDSILGYTLNTLAQMQQSQEYLELADVMIDDRLPQGLTMTDVTFISDSYVPDPQQLCELLFVGVVENESRELIRDEMYVFCRFSMTSADNQPLIMNAMITEQNAVFEIARMAHQTGMLSQEMSAWMMRKLGY